LLKEGIKVSVPEMDSTPGKGHSSSGLRPPSSQRGEENGGQQTARLHVIAWGHPANNNFLLVSQFSVTGALFAILERFHN
jgi:type I restriction enzyme R subunit